MPVKEKRLIFAAIADPYGKSAAISGYVFNEEDRSIGKLFFHMVDIPAGCELTRRETRMLDGLEIIDWEKDNCSKKGSKNKWRF